MIIKKIMWVLNIFAAFALILSFLAALISPETLWWLALFGLGFEILFIINFLFIIYWIIVKNKRFFLSLILVLIGIEKIFGIVQLNFFPQKEDVLKQPAFIFLGKCNIMPVFNIILRKF